MKRAAGVMFLLLPIAGFGAGSSEVADAVMRGDTAAVRKLVEQHADVNSNVADCVVVDGTGRSEKSNAFIPTRSRS